MSERIIKLQSQQNFQEIAAEGAFLSKLIDFNIPSSGLTYDLSKSYINLNISVQNLTGKNSAGNVPDGVILGDDDAMYNNDLGLTDGSAAKNSNISSNSAIVRNADLFSSSRGMVESIRRVNTLRNVLWNMENDEAERHAALDGIGTFQGRRGQKNETSSLVQIIGQNVNPAGQIDTTMKARALSRDFRIPLSDLFGVGSSQWNTDYFGETRIHLEIQPNNLTIDRLGGVESTTPYTGLGAGGVQQTAVYGKMVDYNAAGLRVLPASGAGNPGSVAFGQGNFPLITTITYTDMLLDFPFYVGQAIEVAGNVTGAGFVLTTNPVIIESITLLDVVGKKRFSDASLTNLLIGQVAITTRTPIGVTLLAATNTVVDILVNASKSATTTDTININRAELVLSEIDEAGPRGMDYTTYSTEENQGQPALNNLNLQVMVEPNCSNLIIANCATGLTFSQRAWLFYRLAINNVDQTGNRDIVWGESIHKNRMERFFKNRNQRFTNSSLTQIDTTALQALISLPASPVPTLANQVPFYPILETMPITENMKIVNLELEGVAATPPQDVIFFKELQRSI